MTWKWFSTARLTFNSFQWFLQKFLQELFQKILQGFNSKFFKGLLQELFTKFFVFFFLDFLHGFLSRMVSGIPTRIPTKNMFTICAVDDDAKQTSQKCTKQIMFYYHGPFHIWNLNSFAVHRNYLVVKYQFSFRILHYLRAISHLHNFSGDTNFIG